MEEKLAPLIEEILNKIEQLYNEAAKKEEAMNAAKKLLEKLGIDRNPEWDPEEGEAYQYIPANMIYKKINLNEIRNWLNAANIELLVIAPYTKESYASYLHNTRIEQFIEAAKEKGLTTNDWGEKIDIVLHREGEAAVIMRIFPKKN